MTTLTQIPLKKKHDRSILSASVYLLTKLAYHMAPAKVSRFMRVKGFAIQPYRLNQAQISLQLQARSFFLEFNNNKLKVFEWGGGPVILLVHGWGGRALQMDAFVKALVDKGYKVVAFDHKGHGESSTRFSSYPEFVRGTQVVMAHYGDSLHGVVAHSIGSNAMFKVSENIARKLKIAVVAPMEDFLNVLERKRYRMGIYEKLFTHVINQIETECELCLADLVILQYDKLLQHEVLLVHDTFDRVNKVSASHEIHRNLHGSSLMLTEMLGHSRILRNPAVVERVAAHF